MMVPCRCARSCSCTGSPRAAAAGSGTVGSICSPTQGCGSSRRISAATVRASRCSVALTAPPRPSRPTWWRCSTSSRSRRRRCSGSRWAAASRFRLRLTGRSAWRGWQSPALATLRSTSCTTRPTSPNSRRLSPPIRRTSQRGRARRASAGTQSWPATTGVPCCRSSSREAGRADSAASSRCRCRRWSSSPRPTSTWRPPMPCSTGSHRQRSSGSRAKGTTRCSRTPPRSVRSPALSLAATGAEPQSRVGFHPSFLLLRQAEVVPGDVAEAGVDAVRLLRRLLGEFDAAALQLFVGLLRVVGREEEATRRSLRQQILNLPAGFLLEHGRPRDRHQRDRHVVLTPHADAEPAEVAHLRDGDVLAQFHPELLGVERERFVLVVDPHLHVRQLLEHVFLRVEVEQSRATLATG